MKDKLTFSLVTAALIVMAAIGTSASFANIYAQTQLGEPFFQESGMITDQKKIGPNETQISYSANGTFKGNIHVKNEGDFISISRGSNLTFGQGHGIITSIDSNDTATATFIGVGIVTEEGKPVFNGATAYSTNSTGELAFLKNILGIFKVEIDETGKFTGIEWQWK
jgi:hypothetical protein